jgi:hypothetical protein
LSETERSSEETTTELIPKSETGEGTSRTRELPPPPPTKVKAEPVPGPPLPMPPSTPAAPAPSSSLPQAPPAPDPVEIPTGPMPLVERGLNTGSMPFVESGVPAEPVVPREPFIPPELMARRRPAAPHSAAFAMPQLQAPPLRPAQGAQSPATGSVPIAGEPPERPGEPTGESNRRALLLVVAAAVVVILVVGIAAAVINSRNKPPTAATHSATPTPVATVDLQPTISSFVLKGTGFKLEGKQYVTQTYNTAQFGGLKTGVGLLLDLGKPVSPASINFDAGAGPLTVELRAGDQQSAALSGYPKTGSSTTASGPTSLDANGAGSHRYWLIWVTKLGPGTDGGYVAQIDNVAVKAKG